MALVIQKNVTLSQYTTLHVGGVIDYFAEVTNEGELFEALLFAEQTPVPLLVLGGGSNILADDEGYRGLVLKISVRGSEYVDVSKDETELTVGAGEILDDVVADSVSKNLWGLENLSSIPGTAGATPVQNVGAYGIEVSSLIVRVEAIHIFKKIKKIFTKTHCEFNYRDSFFKTDEGKNWIIISVTFSLSKIPQPNITYADILFLQTEKNLTPLRVREAVQAVRANKFPDWSKVGTAGSFFKNPIITSAEYRAIQALYPLLPGYVQPSGDVKVSLGWILDHVCNLRGYCEGSVCLYDKQALVLVAHTGATSTEIKNFVKNISQKVFLQTKIKIECEVLFV